MKLVVISDTHGYHRDLKKLPGGDVLIHCGDISNVGGQSQIEDFIQWFAEQKYAHKIFIAGNHDRSFDPKFNREWMQIDRLGKEISGHFRSMKPLWLNWALNELNGTNIHYLENNGVKIDGFNFWGSPFTPDFYPQNWAFNCPRGEIQKYWERIPTDTDVLITHGPPIYKLDWVLRGMQVGCEDLARRIDEVKPKYHLFGHIHESYGKINATKTCPTTFVNASVLDESYTIKNKPFTLNLK